MTIGTFRRRHATLFAGLALAVTAVAWVVSIAACRSSGASSAGQASRGTRNAVPMPGPAPPPQRAETAEVLNAQCERCHDEIAAEWRGSLHQTAHLDPLYQRAFAIEPMPFCQGCHAPENSPDQPVPVALGALGVGCVTCHETGHDRILASTRGPSSPGDPEIVLEQAMDPTTHLAAHRIARSTAFSTGAACASCHEFAFPDRVARGGIELMQSTAREHIGSRYASVSCATCHMPRVPSRSGRSHRAHRFDASRDTPSIRGAVKVEAERRGATGARLTLTPLLLGHAFPTGDLFRRLEVVLEAVGADWQVHARGLRYLTRHFTSVRHGSKVFRQVDHDDRPLADPVVVDMDLGEAAVGHPLVWRVSYQRVEHPISEEPGDSVVEGEIEVASGSL